MGALSRQFPLRLMAALMPWRRSSLRSSPQAYWAGSTGRRNTFSLTGLQALVQSFGGSSPSEGLAGPCIERVSNNCEYVRTVCAQIGSFREVLSKQSIGVLVRSALPRAVRFAEVDGKAGCDPQIRMPGHLCSLVPCQRAAKLRWQCRDRPGDGIANRFSPMPECCDDRLNSPCTPRSQWWISPSVDPVGTQAPPTRLRFAHAKRYAKPRGSLLCTTGTTRNNAFGIT